MKKLCKYYLRRNAIKLEVALVKEGDFITAHCPSLEISSYGKSVLEAKTAFKEALDIFLEDTNRKGTLQQYLQNRGWKSVGDC